MPPARASRSEENARSTSLGALHSVVVTRTPSVAARGLGLGHGRPGRFRGRELGHAREAGTTALRNCSRFAVISPTAAECPVMLPPGRASPAANPSPTGSPAKAMTIGMVRVACWTARTAVVGPATITSTLRRTSSSARSWKPLEAAVRVARLEEKVLPLDVPERAEALAKRLALHGVGGRRRGREISDPRDLRTGCASPSDRQRDQERGEREGKAGSRPGGSRRVPAARSGSAPRSGPFGPGPRTRPTH